MGYHSYCHLHCTLYGKTPGEIIDLIKIMGDWEKAENYNGPLPDHKLFANDYSWRKLLIYPLNWGLPSLIMDDDEDFYNLTLNVDHKGGADHFYSFFDWIAPYVYTVFEKPIDRQNPKFELVSQFGFSGYTHGEDETYPLRLIYFAHGKAWFHELPQLEHLNLINNETD